MYFDQLLEQKQEGVTCSEKNSTLTPFTFYTLPNKVPPPSPGSTTGGKDHDLSPAAENGLPHLETIMEKKQNSLRFILKTLDYLVDMKKILPRVVWNEHFTIIHKFEKSPFKTC